MNKLIGDVEQDGIVVCRNRVVIKFCVSETETHLVGLRQETFAFLAIFVSFLGCVIPFQRLSDLSDLQQGDQKVTLNSLVGGSMSFPARGFLQTNIDFP